MKKKVKKVFVNSGKNIEAIFLVIPEVMRPFLHISVANESDSKAMLFIDFVSDIGTDDEDERMNKQTILCLPRKEIFLMKSEEDSLKSFEVDPDMITDKGILAWYLKTREAFKMKLSRPNNGVNQDAKEPRENLA